MRTKTVVQAEKILTAAARLFAAHHFHEARMEDIAEAAEVGKGTLYRYFRDKEELYMALLTRAADQMAGRLRAVEAVSGPRARLAAMVGAILDYSSTNIPHLLDLIQHAEVMQGPGADLPWQRTRLENVRLLQDIFEEARKNGDFVVADPELAAWMLLGGLRPVLRAAPAAPAGPSPAHRRTIPPRGGAAGKIGVAVRASGVMAVPSPAAPYNRQGAGTPRPLDRSFTPPS